MDSAGKEDELNNGAGSRNLDKGRSGKLEGFDGPTRFLTDLFFGTRVVYINSS